jgi:hypothetical protein
MPALVFPMLTASLESSTRAGLAAVALLGDHAGFSQADFRRDVFDGTSACRRCFALDMGVTALLTFVSGSSGLRVPSDALDFGTYFAGLRRATGGVKVVRDILQVIREP